MVSCGGPDIENAEQDGLVRELALFGVSLLRRNGAVSYGDVRSTDAVQRTLSVKNGEVDRVTDSDDRGFGVRLLAGGCWGFAASSELSEEAMARAVIRAVEVAKTSAALGGRTVELCEAEAVVADHLEAVEENPLAAPLEQSLELLVRVSEQMMRVAPVIKVASARMDFATHGRLFASTEGSLIRQHWYQTGGELAATAIEGDQAQVRSYPASMGGNHVRGGYEFIRRLDFAGHAERVAAEAVELLAAPPCPVGVTDLVVDSSQMALQVHESCGHPVELDRVIGDEISLAGGSFLGLEKLGTFRYGSPLVNIVADAALPGALGSFAYDDEGVPGGRFHLVREGLFCGYLASRETAAVAGLERSNGTMRADSWRNFPLIRMTNISLEPGAGSLEDLVAGVQRGVYVETNRSWSIDDQRLNFQFGMELAREIRNGRLGGLLRNPIYSGVTPEFWASCDGIAGPEAWQVWGIPNCGKGEPLQIAHVGHGSSPARFRGVQVGVNP
jgi:TldD protein